MEREEQENWHLVLLLRTHLAAQYEPGVLAMLYIYTKKHVFLYKFLRTHLRVFLVFQDHALKRRLPANVL